MMSLFIYSTKYTQIINVNIILYLYHSPIDIGIYIHLIQLIVRR